LTDPRIDPVCLNYKVSASELEQIKGEPALRDFISPTVDQFNDLVGCANLIESCDVIVGAATTNTALAAACNKPLVLCMAHPERAIFGFGTHHYPFWNWAPAVKIAGRTRSDVVDELFQSGLALVGVHLPPKIATI
jgi:ADP-heptose:LPS heptosyltransferase